jgi:hypothetical protein
MVTNVRLSISGRGAGTDAPLVQDLLNQIGDFFDILNGVSSSIAGDDRPRFEWRITDATHNSPLAFVATAFASDAFPDAEILAATTTKVVASGLDSLIQGRVERPPYFTNNVLEAAHRFTQRFAAGIGETSIDAEDGSPILVITPRTASAAVRSIAIVLEEPHIKAYREFGTIEGHIQNVGADGWGRPFIVVRDRITGDDIKCFVTGEAHHQLETEPVAKVVWRNLRVEAEGTLYYRSLGRLSRAEVSQLRFMRSNVVLPHFADIIDRTLTAGKRTEEYLSEVRNGRT